MKPDKTKRNKTFITFRPESISWIFEVPGDEEGDQEAHILTIIEHLFAATEELFRPTEIKYQLKSVGEDEEKCSSQIKDPNRIVFQDFLFEVSKPGWRVTTATLTGKTRIQLKQGEQEIDSSSEEYKWCTREPTLDKEPTRDPIEISVTQYNLFTSAPFQHDIQITTSTDIWFENSELGEANRRRLSNTLEEIHSQLGVAKVRTESETYPPEQVWSPNE